MSQSKPRKISKTKREMVARKIAMQFNKLSPFEKRMFADETLTALVNMNRRQMHKMFSKMFKKGRPTTQDLETINQLIVVFLYSVKPEFRYHYAFMIYKSLKMPIPPDIEEKLDQVRKVTFLSDIAVSTEVYDKLLKKWQDKGSPPYDKFFTETMNLQ